MYKLILESPAEKFFRKLDRSIKERIAKRLFELEDNPELGKPLTGKLSGLWSLRVGNYRAIYQIKHNELIVLVLKIGHRRNVYD